MEVNQKKTKSQISASVRDKKSPSLDYWINIKRRVKRTMLIGQIMQRNQDHPQGANMRSGIGKVSILMQHIHILILGRQCQCRGCLPMLIQIHIHHGTGMIQGHILRLISDHLINIMQLREDQHFNNHMLKPFQS